MLLGAGLSDLPYLPLPWVLHVAMWVLAVASLVTIAQRLHCVRSSAGAMDPLPQDQPAPPADEQKASGS